jgi:hypothetical protein
MSIFTALRDRISPPDPAVGGSGAEPRDPTAEAPLSFAGYDRLDARQVIDGLRDRSQIELEAVEAYERSHRNREPVLDKLRYMRGPEPLPGYDALPVDEVLAAIEDADLATVKKVRAYERKFAARSAVLEDVVRIQHLRQASRPARSAPAYQPASARVRSGAASRSDDRAQ